MKAFRREAEALKIFDGMIGFPSLKSILIDDNGDKAEIMMDTLGQTITKLILQKNDYISNASIYKIIHQLVDRLEVIHS